MATRVYRSQSSIPQRASKTGHDEVIGWCSLRQCQQGEPFVTETLAFPCVWVGNGEVVVLKGLWCCGADFRLDTMVYSMQNPLCGVMWRAGRAEARQGVEVGCMEPAAVHDRACGRTCAERWEGGAGAGDARGVPLPQHACVA